MTPPLARDTVKSAKAMAQQVAKQMAREPLEVLKTAGASLAITFFTTIILIIISTLPAKMISNFIIKQIK